MPENIKCPEAVPLPSDPDLEGAGGSLSWSKGGQWLPLRRGQQEARPGWWHMQGQPGFQRGQPCRWPSDSPPQMLLTEVSGGSKTQWFKA